MRDFMFKRFCSLFVISIAAFSSIFTAENEFVSSWENCSICGDYVICKPLHEKSLVDFLGRVEIQQTRYRIETLINMQEKVIEKRNVSIEPTIISVEISIELSTLKKLYLNEVISLEPWIATYRNYISNSSNANDIRNYLNEIESLENLINTRKSDIEFMDQLEKKYCSWLTDI